MSIHKLYDILKKEYWPYRYYFVLLIICFTMLKWGMVTITMSRIIRFIVICIILIIYRKVHDYMDIEKQEYSDVKNIKYWMWINIIMNPVLYLVWKWDVYVYYKINEYINKKIKSDKLKKLIIIMIINLNIPIKIIYMRFYIILYITKNSTFYEFMFKKIYGLIISIVIFTNIIQYLLTWAGGYLYLMVNIYIMLYIINVIYTIYYYFFKSYIKSIKINMNIRWVTNMIIYKIISNYIMILNEIEINKVYEYRIGATIIGNYIKQHICKTINIINIEIDQIPEIWRNWVNWNKIRDKTLLHISYKDDEIRSNIENMRIRYIGYMLKEEYLNNNYKKFEKYIDIYIEAIDCLSELFELTESVLIYKYIEYKKGGKECVYKSKKGMNNKYINYNIEIEEYEYIYKMYLLIIKNIIYYIWSLEYYVFQNKNKLTKFYVIDDVYVDFGYHIYPKDKDNFDQYDEFPVLIKEKDYPNNKEIPWNEKTYIVNEGIYSLVDFMTCFSPLVYIKTEKNKELKDIIILLNKYIKINKFNILCHNPFSCLKEDITKEYFQELENVIKEYYKEWESNYMNQENIIEKQGELLLELINHYKTKCQYIKL